MHSAFITELFDWRQRETPRAARLLNAILRRLGSPLRLYAARFSGVMTNVEQRMNMFHLASQVLAYGVPGDFVELGCNAGHSAVLLRKVLDHFDPQRELHLYDSFQGLPPPSPQDGNTRFVAGQMSVTSETLLANFRAVGVAAPVVHAGWFDDTLPNGLPDTIAFAHLDGDFYESILTSLRYVYPRLAPGAICLIDDYADPSVLRGWNELPGVKRACDEFLADKSERVSVLYAGDYAHGYFRKC